MSWKESASTLNGGKIDSMLDDHSLDPKGANHSLSQTRRNSLVLLFFPWKPVTFKFLHGQKSNWTNF